jgi:hypothetical protein
LYSEIEQLDVVLAICDVLNRLDLSNIDLHNLPSTEYELAQKISQADTIIKFLLFLVGHLSCVASELERLYVPREGYRLNDQQQLLYIKSQILFQFYVAWHSRDHRPGVNPSHDLFHFRDRLKALLFKTRRPAGVFGKTERPHCIAIDSSTISKLAAHFRCSIFDLKKHIESRY